MNRHIDVSGRFTFMYETFFWLIMLQASKNRFVAIIVCTEMRDSTHLSVFSKNTANNQKPFSLESNKISVGL